MSYKYYSPLICICLVLLATCNVQADQTFSSQVDFLGAAGAVTTETFENSPNVGSPGSGAMEMLIFDLFEVTSNPPALKVFDLPMFGNFNTTPGGTRYLAADTDYGEREADLTFSFNSPVRSFGFFLIDADADHTVEVHSSEFVVPGLGDGSVAYFGIVADQPFTNVIVNGGFEDSFFSIDDVSIGSVPEPSSAIVTIGVLCFAAVRRKKPLFLAG